MGAKQTSGLKCTFTQTTILWYGHELCWWPQTMRLFFFLSRGVTLFFYGYICIDPCSHWSAKGLKMLYYAARPVVGDEKKNFSPIDWTHNTHVHDVIVLTNSCFCSLHREDNGIVFKNLYFEMFSKVCFQAPKTQLSCKWMAKMHKRFSISSWKRYCVNGP